MAKKRGFQVQNKHLEGHRREIMIFCIVFLTLILCVNLISAQLEFDNVKSFDKDIGKYGKVTIKDWFGLLKLTELELKENTFICGSDCSATTEIIMYQKGVLIDEVRFLVEKGESWKRKNIISYEIYVDDELYNIGDEVEAGTYSMRLEGKKDPFDIIDWQITSQGFLIDEWAVWSGSLNIDLITYYDFEDGSGTNLEDKVHGLFNGTLTDFDGGDDWVTGKVGTYALNLDGVNDYVNISVLPDGWGNISVSLWFKTDDLANNYDFMFIGSASQPIDLNYFEIYCSPVHEIDFYTAGVDAKSDAGLLDDDVWHHLVAVRNSTGNTYLYVDGEINSTGVGSAPSILNLTYFILGNYITPLAVNEWYEGELDEIGIWNRTLTPSEVTQLYNEGTGITFTLGDAIVTLDAPNDNEILNTNEIELNCSVTNTGVLVNNSVYHNATGIWELVQTVGVTGSSNSSNFTTTIISSAIWNCKFCDTAFCVWANANFTVTSDIITPLLSITYPTEIVDFGSEALNISLNWSVSDANLDSCWYNYNDTSVNVSLTCLDLTTTFLIDGDFSNITLYANDSVGNVNSSFVEWDYTIWVDVESYLTSVPEGSDQNFYVNVTNAQETLTPYLVYDGVSYIGTYTYSGDEFYCSRTLDIPPISADINKTFYWSFLMADTSVINITTHNITVTNFAIDNCTVNTVEIMNLLLKVEENNTLLEDASSNIEVEIDIYSLDDVLIGEYNRQWLNESNVSICVKNLTSVNYYLYMTSEFLVDDYVNEFYFIDKTPLNKSIIPINISLMDLLATDSTSFLFNYFDLDGLIVANPIIHTFRKYIGEGLFREVERSKQNDDGNIIVHLVEEDVIYFFQVSQNDTVIFTSETYTALCDDTPCTIVLEESGGFAPFSEDYDLVDNGGYSMVANSMTREVNLTFATTSPSTFNLTVYKLDDQGDIEIIGSSETTGTSGSVSVIVPQISGNTSFFGAVYQDGNFIKSKWINFEEDAGLYFGNTLAIFLGFLIILCLGLMAMNEGSATIIFLILGMVLTMILGLIDYRTSIGVNVLIYIILAGGLILWKLTKK